MMGSGFGVSAPGVRTLIQSRGDAGSALHAGGFPLQRHSISAVRNGRTHADYVNVVFVLRDVAEADGGFVSHPKPSLRLASDSGCSCAGVYTRLS